jgi:non-ribosomal peptide synthetase component E (peptide arylation enzyme)
MSIWTPCPDPARAAHYRAAGAWTADSIQGCIASIAVLRAGGVVIVAGRFRSTDYTEHLAAHPAVQEAVVIGIPHERLGETSCAVVVLRPGAALTLEMLTAYLDGRGVARFKFPERLELVPAMPKTLSGKIQKYVLRDALKATREAA